MSRGNKSVGVQYLRAFACIAVFLSHLIGALPETTLQFGSVNLNDTPLRMVWGGNVGVIIFFVISGFFQGADHKELSFRSYGNYIIKRHLRIYPTYLLALLITIVARKTALPFDQVYMSSWIGSFWKGEISLKQCLSSAVLVAPFDADMLNPVIWTLRIELRMCFLLPLVQWLMKRWNPVVVCILCILMGAYVPTLTYLPVFSIGMATYIYKDRLWKYIQNNKLALGILAFLLMDFSYICNWLNIEMADDIQHNVMAFGAAVMVLCVYDITAKRTKTGAFLEEVGNQSYYIYIIHMVVMLWCRFICSYLGFAGYTVAVICITYGVAVIISWADRLMNRRFARLIRFLRCST